MPVVVENFCVVKHPDHPRDKQSTTMQYAADHQRELNAADAERQKLAKRVGMKMQAARRPSRLQQAEFFYPTVLKRRQIQAMRRSHRHEIEVGTPEFNDFNDEVLTIEMLECIDIAQSVKQFGDIRLWRNGKTKNAYLVGRVDESRADASNFWRSKRFGWDARPVHFLAQWGTDVRSPDQLIVERRKRIVARIAAVIMLHIAFIAIMATQLHHIVAAAYAGTGQDTSNWPFSYWWNVKFVAAGTVYLEASILFAIGLMVGYILALAIPVALVICLTVGLVYAASSGQQIKIEKQIFATLFKRKDWQTAAWHRSQQFDAEKALATDPHMPDHVAVKAHRTGLLARTPIIAAAVFASYRNQNAVTRVAIKAADSAASKSPSRLADAQHQKRRS